VKADLHCAVVAGRKDRRSAYFHNRRPFTSNTKVDTGPPEDFVEYGSKHGYTPVVKRQCLFKEGDYEKNNHDVHLVTGGSS
jgi:hypothetical protein